jgi:hypothetical protein
MNDSLVIAFGSMILIVLAALLLPAAKVRILALGAIRILAYSASLAGVTATGVFFYVPSAAPRSLQGMISMLPGLECFVTEENARLIWLVAAIAVTVTSLPVLELVSHAWRVAGQNLLLRQIFTALRNGMPSVPRSRAKPNDDSQRAFSASQLGEMEALADAVRSISTAPTFPAKRRRTLAEIVDQAH